MTYSSPPTLITGSTWTAANHNQYIVDNFASIYPIVRYRIGPSSTLYWSMPNGSTAGTPTTTYIPKNSLLQIGSVKFSSTGDYRIVFPSNQYYTVYPMIFFNSNVTNSINVYVVFADGFNAHVYAPCTVFWMALGE